MTSVGAVALGLLLALLDLRISGVDVLPDVLGWLLALSGLTRLVRRHEVFRATWRWAQVTTLLSLADLGRAQVTTTTPTMTSTADAAPAGLHGWLVTAYGLSGTVVAVLLSLALRDVARAAGDRPLAERFTTFARLHAVSGAVLVAGGVLALLTTDDGSIEPTGALAGLTFVVVMAVLAVQVLFLLALRGARERSWLQDRPAAQPHTDGADPAAGAAAGS